MRRRAIRWLLAFLGAGALVQALMYLDALAAFRSAPEALAARMQSTVAWLLVAIAADTVAGLLVIAGTVAAGRRCIRSAE